MSYSSRGSTKPSGDDIYEGYQELAGATNRILSTVAAASGGVKPTLGRAGSGIGVGVSGGLGGVGGGAGTILASQMRAPATSAPAASRPMSSIRAAGYSSSTSGVKSTVGYSGVTAQSKFDPLGRATHGPTPPLVKKTQDSPVEQVREAERGVHTLLEEASRLMVEGNKTLALEKAKEAVKAERALVKQYERIKDLSEHDQVCLMHGALFFSPAFFSHSE